MVARRVFVGLGLFLLGCSADSVDEREPTLDTIGVFVARSAPDGGYTLHRVLYALRLQTDDTSLFISTYAVHPSTLDGARALARSGPLPVDVEVQVVSQRQFGSVPYEIVWFRSLTPEERARVL
jgi:hypothetical protein